MKTSPWLMALLVSCVSCGRQNSVSDGKDTETQPLNVSNNPTSIASEAGRSADKSISSTASTPGPQPWFYSTNGNVVLKIYAITNAGQITSSRALDADGTLKWTDQYSYDAGSKRLVASRRTRSDGTVVQVLYQYSSDGKQTRMVIDRDGKAVPPAEQDAVLNQ